MDELYAAIETWVKEQFFGWEIEPHLTPRGRFRSFKPIGRFRGAIYGRTPRGCRLVFICDNREKFLLRKNEQNVNGFRIVRVTQGDRLAIYIPAVQDFSGLNLMIGCWRRDI